MRPLFNNSKALRFVPGSFFVSFFMCCDMVFLHSVDCKIAINPVTDQYRNNAGTPDWFAINSYKRANPTYIMAEEWFDVVDKNDAVVGRELRSVVHEKNLLHRAVHVLVFNSKGEIFLQKRSMKKDQCPGMWGTSCAGHLDSGEDYDHAARREFKEELGIEPPPLARMAKIAPGRETGYEHVWIYTCNCEGPFELSEEEIECGEWRKTKGLAGFMQARPREYTSSLRTVWNAYLANAHK
jgi:isopentenyl-diphosphate Delta-isomerase